MLWALFGFSGRIGRQVYWLALFGPQAVITAMFLQLMGGEEASYAALASALSPFVSVLGVWSSVAIAVKRLHDIGMNGLWAVAIAIPFVNLAFTVWLGIVPPQPGANRYGAAADVPPT